MIYSNIKINPNTREVAMNKTVIFLRNKEFTLLEYFIRNAGQVLTRTRIMEEVWDRNICCPTNTIDVHVSKLRKKLDKYSGIKLIKTIHCVGYLFGGDSNY